MVPKFAQFSQLISLEFKEAQKAAFITLSNPKKRNTLSSAAMNDLRAALT